MATQKQYNFKLNNSYDYMVNGNWITDSNFISSREIFKCNNKIIQYEINKGNNFKCNKLNKKEWEITTKNIQLPDMDKLVDSYKNKIEEENKLELTLLKTEYKGDELNIFYNRYQSRFIIANKIYVDIFNTLYINVDYYNANEMDAIVIVHKGDIIGLVMPIILKRTLLPYNLYVIDKSKEDEGEGYIIL